MVSKTPVDKLKHEPRTCCFYFKYVFTCLRYYIYYGCKVAAGSPLFEVASLLVICTNCTILATDDPTKEGLPYWIQCFNVVFQAIYTVELVMKMVAFGIVVPEGAFLRDVWNIADLLIVIFGFLDLSEVLDIGFDPRPLRIFRVFRPFGNAIRLEGVKSIMIVLSTSLYLLVYFAIIYLLYLIIFAVIGLQLWHDKFDMRCMNEATKEFDRDLFCGASGCPDGYACSYYGETLGHGHVSFDDFPCSLLLVLIVSTDEGGPAIQKALIESEGYYVAVYFTLILLIGNYFLKHFILGVFQYNVNLFYLGNHNVIEEKVAEVVTTPTFRRKTLKAPSDFHDGPEFPFSRNCPSTLRRHRPLEVQSRPSQRHHRPRQRADEN